MDVTEIQLLQRLAVALGIGLLIGAERGWAERDIAEGARVAGIRTFGLLALLGAVWALLSDGHALARAIEIGLGFLGLAMLLTAAHWLRTTETRSLGITTEAVALLTFALGATAMQGHLGVAVSVAVVTTILLGLKPTLHAWLARLEPKELHAALKLLLISVVVLPVLPDRGFGPWQAFNPYENLVDGGADRGYLLRRIRRDQGRGSARGRHAGRRVRGARGLDGGDAPPLPPGTP